MQPKVILSVAGEGGGYTILGVHHQGNWQLWSDPGSSDAWMYDDFEDEPVENLSHEPEANPPARSFDTLDEVLGQINSCWPTLSPIEVHLDFSNDVWNRVVAYHQRAQHPHKTDVLQQWSQMCLGRTNYSLDELNGDLIKLENFSVFPSSMVAPTEKQLDEALDSAFSGNPEFVKWFLSKTKFADRGATYVWSRADHPWGRVNYVSTNIETGLTETCVKESETDVLVVLRTQDGETVALHIENKVVSGKFTALQPVLYARRAEQWKNNPKYQSYSDYQTVLVAPKQFHERNRIQAGIFDVFISHEDVAKFISLFGQRAKDR